MNNYNTYSIGDIHGMVLQLVDALEWIKQDTGSTPCVIVLLGDYVDRGPASKEVIDTLIALRDRVYEPFDELYYDIMFLRGNHEAMMLMALLNGSLKDLWISNGGAQTLQSYNVSNALQCAWIYNEMEEGADKMMGIPSSHIDFLNDTQIFIETDNLVFVHAGLPENDLVAIRKDLEDKDNCGHIEDTLMWVRDRFLNSRFDWGKRVVHGHTITDDPVIRSNRIGLDVGCFWSGNLAIAKWGVDTSIDPDVHIVKGNNAKFNYTRKER